jgi:hypothetical protein
MTIGNLEVIDIGLPNESTGSDSLYLAFNKTKNNFAILANTASQYVTFTGNTGIGVNANATTGAVDITNTGVISLTAGDSSINLSEPTPGNILITATGGGGNGGGVSSVGVSSSTLTVTNTPIISAGNIVVNLPTTGVVASQYTNPTVTVDTYGRITNIANNTVSGTVTSVSITPGTGIQVTTSGNSNVNPGFTLINTGVTRITQGSGIRVTSGNGDVTISTTPVAAVTSISVASTSLTVTGSPITGSGTITVDLPSNISVSGNITGGNLITAGNTVVGGIKTDNYYYANGVAISFAGSYGNSNVSSFLAAYGSNTITTTGNITGGNLIGIHYGAGTGLTSIPGANVTGTVPNATIATTAGTVTTAAQPNITSTGTLASLSVTANANIGNIGTAGVVTATGNIDGGNIITAGVVSATGNVTGNFFIGNGSQLTGISGPIFSSYNSINQSLSTGTANLVYSTALVNTGTYYDVSTGIYTPLIAGWYQVNASMIPELTSGVANASFFLSLYKNGTIDAVGPSTTVTTTWGDIGISALSKLIYFNGTSDNINCKLTSTINTGTWRTGISPVNFFQATWVHA